ncbi:MAG: hypothetical protein A2103_00320 [Gammaproteobacteria bacterium GWF2_41_13]|nr:MAG: hypothetical protein A2103_00320 [Gammaproteobacteria bacterium GWF2_41_13]
MNPTEILSWLHTENSSELEKLWAMANQVRQEHVGNEVHLRGLVEISNHCVRTCTYCGINRTTAVERYRMTKNEMIDCAKQIEQFGYGTIVMQSGEDYGLTAENIADIICTIKSQTPLAITLSLGERPLEELHLWKQSGADRYLLRFETSDPFLYRRIHPPLTPQEMPDQRIQLLKQCRELGLEIGSGIMIGIPGQTYESIVNDLRLFQSLDLDMIGVGPYIENSVQSSFHGSDFVLDSAVKLRDDSDDTIKLQDKNHSAIKPKNAPATTESLAVIPRLDRGIQREISDYTELTKQQVPATELMTYKIIALSRILCPKANIPSTTALATLNKTFGRELGLSRGANVVMPNVTPVQYRVKYEIYPGKACINECASACHRCMTKRIRSIGRTIGQGKGGRRK